ncbi:MAG: hypothetical protein HQ485_08150 [Acidobacteria bacterium]|nr:hypothetical protein [Acidobacteriota bacterium]
MTDETFTGEERRWLAVWDEKVAQVASGALTDEEVREWVWKNKVLNAIGVTIQRIKRANQPGKDPRRTDNTWVTVSAERGVAKSETSELALHTLAYVRDRLNERGHDYDVDWMASSRGLIVISINVKSLRAYMNRPTTSAPPTT